MTALTVDQLAPYLQTHFRAAAARAILSAANRIVQVIVTEIIPQTNPQPVDQGFYRSGFRAQPMPGGAELKNTMPYASIIEWGARAENIKVGRKMIDALTEWVTRKRLPLDKGQTPRQVAWAIAMAMKRRGIFHEGKGLRVVERAMERFPEILRQEFARELKREFG